MMPAIKQQVVWVHLMRWELFANWVWSTIRTIGDIHRAIATTAVTMEAGRIVIRWRTIAIELRNVLRIEAIRWLMRTTGAVVMMMVVGVMIWMIVTAATACIIIST